MTSSYYLETSAFLQVVFQETGSQESRKKIENADRLIASRLLRVEVFRSLARLKLNSSQDELAANELTSRCETLLATVDLVEISAEICSRAERVFPSHPLRSLDAIHIATFLMLQEKFAEIEMLSHDHAIRKALNLG